MQIHVCVTQNIRFNFRPGYGTKDPVDVFVNIYVNSFGSISANTMDYKGEYVFLSDLFIFSSTLFRL